MRENRSVRIGQVELATQHSKLLKPLRGEVADWLNTKPITYLLADDLQRTMRRHKFLDLTVVQSACRNASALRRSGNPPQRYL